MPKQDIVRDFGEVPRMVRLLRTFSHLGCACCLVGLACVPSRAEETWPRLARRELTAILPADESPVPLPPVTIPDPVAYDGLRNQEGAPSEKRPLTLADLQVIAQQQNPTLVQAQMAVRAAQGRQIQAGLYPNPEIAYTGEEIGSEGRAGLQGTLITQEIVTAGKRQLAESVAGHGASAARYRLEAQRWRVLNAVRTGFYEVLLAQQTVRVNQDLVRVGNEAVDITSRLRAAQEVSKAEVLQAMIEAERAEVSLFAAKNRHRIAWYHLAAVLGQPEMPPAPLEGDLIKDLPTVTWDDGLARLLTGKIGRASCRERV